MTEPYGTWPKCAMWKLNVVLSVSAGSTTVRGATVSSHFAAVVVKLLHNNAQTHKYLIQRISIITDKHNSIILCCGAIRS